MIVPPGTGGTAFTEAVDGDLRHDSRARARLCATLGISSDWATLHQQHGSGVVEAVAPGTLGDGDAAWSTVPGLPLAVFTADCFGVVVHADGAVGVAHAGWRGAALGVVAGLVDAMAAAGHTPDRAVVGPGIGPCCFEVGDEVAARFPEERGSTTWDTVSVDLVAAIRGQVEGIETMVVEGCTRHLDRFFSHRRDGTPRRQAAIGWVR